MKIVERSDNYEGFSPRSPLSERWGSALFSTLPIVTDPPHKEAPSDAAASGMPVRYGGIYPHHSFPRSFWYPLKP